MPATKNDMKICCERCAYWAMAPGETRGDPVCQQPDSSKCWTCTGAAAGCGLFEPRR